ncbi:MAG: cell wall anchor protein, partial [Bacteroidales bacterium]|nr:cell wall anchor protein [Bacteroidales bacterium]
MIKNLMIVVTLCSTTGISRGQVGIGTNNPNPNAVLHIHSNEGKGVLIPRVYTITSITIDTSEACPDGMLVYDLSQSCFQF